MKASSGRLGQYSLLNSEESLSGHLLETKLFSEASFYDFMSKYKTFVIKPVYGPGEISVITDNNTFRIASKTYLLTCSDKEEVYHHLVRNEMKQKYYIVQQVKPNSRYFQNYFQQLFTVHRKSASAQWCLISKTVKNSSILGNFLYMYFFRKIENLSILAAKKLGESFPSCNTITIEIVYDLKGEMWIQDTVLHFPKSKWSQYHTFTANSSLDFYVPDTDLLTKDTFNQFLIKYNDVIIKPCYGKEGSGIVKISSDNHLSYEIHSGSKKITKADLEETYHFIEENYLTEKYYIVQQKLPLATINDCPIDSRVVVQKVDSTWRTTGKIFKVAGKGFFITNAAQKLLSLENAIQDSEISTININTLETEMDKICITAARQLEENNPGTTIIGFDIAITDKGDIWIIEGNYNPNLSMFNMLEDKRIYKDMLKAKRN